MLLGGFARAHVAGMDTGELEDFEHLLEARDNEIYAWLCGTAPVPAEYDTPLFARLKAYRPNLEQDIKQD